jgi:putative addiction module component (TIGR02574 family)
MVALGMVDTDELLKLDVQERLRLIDKLWDSVLQDLNDPDSPDSLPVTDQLRTLLDRRARAYRANPDNVSSWPDVRERILRRR